MGGAKIQNKTTVQVMNTKAIDGVDKYLANIKSLMIAGTSYAPADLKAALQAEIDGNNAADASRAQYRQQVVAARLTRSKGTAVRQALKTWILSTHGADAVQMFENFGIPVPKGPGRKTAATKAEAAVEAAATRKARKEALASLDAGAPSEPGVAGQPAAVVSAPKS
jgi:hypothetical protein